MAKQNTARRDIQFLRAFAVLSVIAYHFELAGLGGGFIGVDIFFVISGYLIFGKVHGQLVRREFSLSRFFEARIRRIFPALAVVVIATALWGWYFSLARDYLYYSRTALAALLFLSNHAFMGLQGYFDAASFTKPLLHTWSLSVEGQFYFWLPLMLTLFFKASLGPKIRYLLTLIAILSLGIAFWMAYQTPESGFYYVYARAWEFVVGAFCALLIPSQHRHARLMLLVSALALMASVPLLGSSAWPNVWTLLPVLATAAFIYFAANAQDNPVIANPVLQLAGDMSYSLYLWHWPIWVFARQQYGEQIPLADKLLLLALIFVLSWLSWRWIERPFRDRTVVTGKQLKWATITVLLFTLAFTAFMVANKGYTKRFPDYVARAAIQSAQTTPRRECFRFDLNTKEAPEQFCVYGASNQAGDATSILWGDSFANQYLTPLSNASKAAGITGLIATMSGCRAFIETDTIQYPDNAHCKDFNREVYAFLLNHTEIKTVVLGRAWWNSDETIERTVQLMRELIVQGRKVILLTPPPEPGMDVATAWATRQIRAGHAIDEIKVDATPQVTLGAILNKLKAKLKAEIASGDVYPIDPTRHFCDEKYCYMVRDGMATFRDAGHLTELSAQKMEPDFRAALLKVLP